VASGDQEVKCSLLPVDWAPVSGCRDRLLPPAQNCLGLAEGREDHSFGQAVDKKNG